MSKTKLARLLDFFFPRFCLNCGKPGQNICSRCVSRYLTPYFVQQCHVCGVESRIGLAHLNCAHYSSLDGVLIGFTYSGLAKKVIHHLKYKHQFLIGQDIADLMVSRLRAKIELLKITDITFVPTTKKRRRERGFDQAELLAKQVSQILNMPSSRYLTREGASQSQVGRGALERSQNIANDYFVCADVSGQTLLLVDDVMTTGATLESCAGVLKRAGADRIYGLVFARNPDFAIVNQL
jgi:competence protein ComFC